MPRKKFHASLEANLVCNNHLWVLKLSISNQTTFSKGLSLIYLFLFLFFGFFFFTVPPVLTVDAGSKHSELDSPNFLHFFLFPTDSESITKLDKNVFASVKLCLSIYSKIGKKKKKTYDKKEVLLQKTMVTASGEIGKSQLELIL